MCEICEDRSAHRSAHRARGGAQPGETRAAVAVAPPHGADSTRTAVILSFDFLNFLCAKRVKSRAPDICSRRVRNIIRRANHPGKTRVIHGRQSSPGGDEEALFGQAFAREIASHLAFEINPRHFASGDTRYNPVYSFRALEGNTVPEDYVAREDQAEPALCTRSRRSSPEEETKGGIYTKSHQRDSERRRLRERRNPKLGTVGRVVWLATRENGVVEKGERARGAERFVSKRENFADSWKQRERGVEAGGLGNTSQHCREGEGEARYRSPFPLSFVTRSLLGIAYIVRDFIVYTGQSVVDGEGGAYRRVYTVNIIGRDYIRSDVCYLLNLKKSLSNKD